MDQSSSDGGSGEYRNVRGEKLSNLRITWQVSSKNESLARTAWPFGVSGRRTSLTSHLRKLAKPLEVGARSDSQLKQALAGLFAFVAVETILVGVLFRGACKTPSKPKNSNSGEGTASTQVQPRPAIPALLPTIQLSEWQ